MEAKTPKTKMEAAYAAAEKGETHILVLLVQPAGTKHIDSYEAGSGESLVERYVGLGSAALNGNGNFNPQKLHEAARGAIAPGEKIVGSGGIYKIEAQIPLHIAVSLLKADDKLPEGWLDEIATSNS